MNQSRSRFPVRNILVMLASFGLPMLILGTMPTAVRGAVSPPTLQKEFGATSVRLNGKTSLTFTVTNPNTTTLTNIGFTDVLPDGIALGNASVTGGCGGGSIELAMQPDSITLSGATLAGGAQCTFSADVKGTSPGTHVNTTSAVTSTEGGTGGTASATLIVVAPPVISKAFGSASIPQHVPTSLTFTVTNPTSNTVAEEQVTFTDPFPSGLVVATPNGLSNACGGTATAAEGSSSVSLSGATVGVQNNCTLSVNVVAHALGTLNNTSGPISSANGGTGNTASASLTVTARLLLPLIRR